MLNPNDCTEYVVDVVDEDEQVYGYTVFAPCSMHAEDAALVAHPRAVLVWANPRSVHTYMRITGTGKEA